MLLLVVQCAHYTMTARVEGKKVDALKKRDDDGAVGKEDRIGIIGGVKGRG